MAEKRHQSRIRRRLSVKYGERDLSHTGFTIDVSRTGTFILSLHRPALHSRIHLQVFLHPDQPVYFEALVQRHKLVPRELGTFSKGGFGVRFLLPAEILGEMILDSEHCIEVHYSTIEELRDTYQREFCHGGLFVRTQRRFASNAEVILILHLDFADKNLEFPASVVEVGGSEALKAAGVAVLFRDGKLIRESLSPYLS
jgi:Tfp pilus assembly protein PilZ